MASQSFLTPALREIAGKVAGLLKEKGESIAVAETVSFFFFFFCFLLEWTGERGRRRTERAL